MMLQIFKQREVETIKKMQAYEEAVAKEREAKEIYT